MNCKMLLLSLMLISLMNVNAQWVNQHVDLINNFTTKGTYNNIITPATTSNGDLNTTFLPTEEGTSLLWITKGALGPFIVDYSEFTNTLIMYPSNNVNKYGIYNINYASPVVHSSATIMYDSITNTPPPNGMSYTWSIGNSSTNNGNIYQSRNSIYTSSTAFKAIFTVLKTVYNSTNKNYVMSYRTGGTAVGASYAPLSNATFVGGVKYIFEVFCNNYIIEKSYIAPDGSTNTVPPGTFHIWVTNTNTSAKIRVGLPSGGGFDIPRTVETVTTTGDASIDPNMPLNAFVTQGGGNASQTGFAIFYGGGKMSYLTPRGLLPVTFLSSSFKGRFLDNTVLLNWSTASEQNNAYFEVQHSTEGKNFKAIGRVAGHLTTSLQQNYAFTDDNPSSGMNYYKLSQVDIDGKTTFNSDIVVVNAPQPQNAFKVYMNGTQLNATTYVATAGEGDLRLFSISGQQVLNKKVKLNQGKNTITVEVSSLNSGTYIAVIKSEKGEEKAKFIK